MPVRSLSMALAGALLVCPGCLGGSTTPSTSSSDAAPARLATFADRGLSFSYPASWRRYRWQFSTSFSDAIVYLSTGAEHDPCTTTGLTTRCTPPIDRLEPDGVLVSWTRWYDPGFGLERVSGTPTRIADHPAKVTVGAPQEWCARIGGERSVTASIAPAGYRVDRYGGLSPRSRHRRTRPCRCGGSSHRCGTAERLRPASPAVACRRRLHLRGWPTLDNGNARAVLRLRSADVASRILRIAVAAAPAAPARRAASPEPADQPSLVDDWFETGSQALTAVALIEQTGARYAGASIRRRPAPGCGPATAPARARRASPRPATAAELTTVEQHETVEHTHSALNEGCPASLG